MDSNNANGIRYTVREKDYLALEKILENLSEHEKESHEERIDLHFTADEIKSLKRVAARERAWNSLGILASSGKTIITYLGFMIVTYLAIKGYLVEWILSITKN